MIYFHFQPAEDQQWYVLADGRAIKKCADFQHAVNVAIRLARKSRQAGNPAMVAGAPVALRRSERQRVA